MNHGVKPNKLWHWAAIAVIIATVIHNPGGSAEFAITTLDKTGSAIGWGLTRGGFDGESDYFVDPATATQTPPPAPAPAPAPGPAPAPAPVPGSGDTLEPADGSTEQSSVPNQSRPSRFYGRESDLRGLADAAVVEVIGLHELVEQALAPEGEQP